MKSIGIDLGSSNIRIYVEGKGVVVDEPSAVAVESGTGEVLSVGLAAARMAGKTPEAVTVCRPIRAGVIALYDAAVAMADILLTKAVGNLSLHHPRVMVGIPYSVNDVEKRAVEEVILDAGAKSVALIESSLAAAIGAGMRVTHPRGNMIVDIGGGTTEIAVMSLGGIVTARSLRVGGDAFDEALCGYVRRKYNIMISDTTAEYCKKNIGTVLKPLGAQKDMEIRGRDIITGLPVTVKLSSTDMKEAFSETVGQILEGVRATLETTPPELASDLLEDGIVVTGGGALLGGMAQCIANATHVRVTTAKKTLDATVTGLGRLSCFPGDVDRIIRFRSK